MEIKKLDIHGLNFIARAEGGYVLNVYKDSAGICTISAGVTYYPNGKRVAMTDPVITTEYAQQLFASILPTYEKGVWAFTRDDINQNQFNALVSLCYNIGVNAFRNSTVLRRVNKDPNMPAIRDAFMLWNKGNGKVIKGLVNRRAAEANLYFKK